MSTKMLRIFTLCAVFFLWANAAAAVEDTAIKCPPNMHHAVCGSACPAKCPVRKSVFRCLAIVCPKNTCYCNSGYVLKGPNHCVKPKDC